ncbi:MAG: anti-sigma F factor [Clostridia bacterium]|nr:anti-sigma F factor [Clostridia bacterium]
MKKELINEMNLRIPALSVNESFARYAVSSFVSQLDPTLEEIADIRTVVSEAVTNSVIHGYRDSKGDVFISVKYYSDRSVKITVRDRGCGIADIEKVTQPFYTGDPAGERGGMGFTIMSSFTDKMKIKSVLGRGTAVILIKRLHKDA